MKFEILPVPATHRAALSSMTFPTYQPLLQPTSPAASHLLCLVAESAEGEAVGLLLGLPDAEQTHGFTLLSIFVQPAARRCGIGTALMKSCQEICQRHGVQRIETTWTDKPSARPIENILASTGWSPPAMRMLSGKLNLAATLSHPSTWCVPVPLPPGARYLPWHEVTADQRRRLIQTQSESPWIPEDLYPIRVESLGPVEPHSAIALEMDGEIVGWSLPQPLRPGLVRGTASFVRTDLQRRGRMIGLMHESFTRAIAAGYTTGVWTTPLHHPSMIRLIHRRIAPLAEYVRETRGSYWCPPPA